MEFIKSLSGSTEAAAPATEPEAEAAAEAPVAALAGTDA